MADRILLVEDDLAVLGLLQDYLSQDGFVVESVSDLKSARNSLAILPDLVVLDWMLPDGQGIELIREFRESGLRVPVILLTARSDLIDKVLGLELGANDYMTKPFAPRELVARIRAQIRSRKGDSSGSLDRSSLLTAGDICLNRGSMEVSFCKEPVTLTRMEFSLLEFFLENPNQVFSRDEILDSVWGLRYPTTRTVDMHIAQLRQKFEPIYFETVHGTGYRFRDKPSKERP
jgi:DNA-binding response OmpR family regulator